ncbi:MAG: hypothetical protein DRG11_04650 [Epsilonproteobacteria bacterium]|nr:MAG: hypothetical protein DRG11_04650 [Campylobacterota bacterium]
MKLVVYPTSRAIRKHIENQKETNQLFPKLITIADMFNRSVDIADKKFIDSSMLMIYLYKAINFSGFDILGLKNSFTEQFIKSNDILNTLNELSLEGVNIDKLFDNQSYSLYKKHIQVLKQVRQNLLNQLDREGYVGKVNLPQNYKLNKSFVLNYSQVVMYIEGYLSGFEIRIINDICKVVDVVLEFNYTKYNKENIDKLLLNNLCLDYNYSYNITTKQILHKHKLQAITSNIKIKTFDSEIDEIAYIKHSIYDAVNNQQIKPENIAVILPDESMAKYLRLFDDKHNFNYAFGFDILSSKLYQTIKTIENNIINTDKQQESLYKFLEINDEFMHFVKTSYDKIIDKNLCQKFSLFVFPLCDTKELRDIVDHVIYDLTLISNHININLKDYLKIFLYKLSIETTDDTSGGKVTIMGLLETRAMKYKAVIVCNFNNHLVPKQLQKDKLLNSNIKTSIGLPTSTNRTNLQAYYYDMLFKNAKHIYISYDKTQDSYISKFAKLVLNYQAKDHQTQYKYRTILYKQQTYTHIDEDIVLNIDLSIRSWSSSSLETYLSCKKKFLFANIYNIKEPTNIYKPKGYEIGNILHKALENTYKQKNSFFDEKQLYETIVENIKVENIKNPYTIFDIQLWKDRLRKFVKNEITMFKNGIKIDKIEHSFVDEKYGIKISGKIDRIDMLPNNTINIIDYKTSKKTIVNENNYQLVFYYLAMNQQNIKGLYYYNIYHNKLLKLLDIQDRLNELQKIFKQLKTASVSFDKCEGLSYCRHCAYKTICQRD